VHSLCGPEVVLASPREASARGSHVVFGHPQGYAVMQSLIARRIIGDFRPPNLMRFGFAPLYTSFEDVWFAATAIAEILELREWDRRGFVTRQKVT